MQWNNNSLCFLPRSDAPSWYVVGPRHAARTQLLSRGYLDMLEITPTHGCMYLSLEYCLDFGNLGYDIVKKDESTRKILK